MGPVNSSAAAANSSAAALAEVNNASENRLVKACVSRLEEWLPKSVAALVWEYAPQSIHIALSIRYLGNPIISLAKIGNEITADHIVQVRESSPDVEHLNLSGCRLTADLVAEVAKLKNLKCLILDALHPQEVEEGGMKHLAQLSVLPLLQRLDIRDFPSSSDGAIFRYRLEEESIGMIKSLTTINIGFGFSPPGVRDIRNRILRYVPSLKDLYIHNISQRSFEARVAHTRRDAWLKWLC